MPIKAFTNHHSRALFYNIRRVGTQFYDIPESNRKYIIQKIYHTENISYRKYIRKRVYCAFIDYCKAFYSVDISLLWQKLLSYNINGKVLNIIRDCITLDNLHQTYCMQKPGRTKAQRSKSPWSKAQPLNSEMVKSPIIVIQLPNYHWGII